MSQPTAALPSTVCMLVKNSFEFDARVDREARTLLEAGCAVTVVALRSSTTPAEERRPDGLHVVRVGRDSRLLRRFVPPSTARAGGGEGGGAQAGNPRHGALAVIRRIAAVLLGVLGPVLRPLRESMRDRHMRRAAMGTGAAVFHAHDLNTLHLAVTCAQRVGAQVVYDAHELHGARSRSTARERQRAQRRERSLLPKADVVVTASPGYAAWMTDRYGIETPRVLLNVPEHVRDVDAVDLHALLDIDATQTIVLYQGSIQEHRGLEQLIDAVATLSDVTLVVIGYGHHRPELERRAIERGAQDRVRFTGAVPHAQLLRYTAGADIGTCTIVGSAPSYELSMPNKLFEYAMAGVPVVASHYEHMGGFVEEHGTGVTCDPLDPISVAAAVRRLVDDPALAEDCRANAVRAAERFRWEVEREVLLDTYADLDVGGSREPR